MWKGCLNNISSETRNRGCVHVCFGYLYRCLFDMVQNDIPAAETKKIHYVKGSVVHVEHFRTNTKHVTHQLSTLMEKNRFITEAGGMQR